MYRLLITHNEPAALIFFSYTPVARRFLMVSFSSLALELRLRVTNTGFYVGILF